MMFASPNQCLSLFQTCAQCSIFAWYLLTHPFSFDYEKCEQLMEILDNYNISDIISWLPNGRAFRIHDTKRLVSEVVPMYFQEISNPTFPAFKRRMKHWRFEQESSSSDESNQHVYHHPLFIKGEANKCLEMRPKCHCHDDVSTTTNGLAPDHVSSYDANIRTPMTAPLVSQTYEGHESDEQLLRSVDDLTLPTSEEHAMHRHLLEMDQSYQHLYLKSLKEVQAEHLAHLEVQIGVSHVALALSMTPTSDIRSPSIPSSPSSSSA